MIFNRARTRIRNETTYRTITLEDPREWRMPAAMPNVGETGAMKVATVNACVNIRSDSIGKLPIYVFDEKTKEAKPEHPLNVLLNLRPNRNMTPFVFKKLMETYRLMRGNAYALIITGTDGRPVELLPISPEKCQPFFDDAGQLAYAVMLDGKNWVVNADSMIHLKGYTGDGIKGVSVLTHAADVIADAKLQQQYGIDFYRKSAAPPGILTVDSEISKESKDAIRAEWERVHGGIDNRFRVAVMDQGMDYKPIGLTQQDAQFVESKELSVAEIARFFNVPLYKLQSGKQAYSSNEQNAIEYVVGAIHPTVQQYEEELTYKCLLEPEYLNGLQVRVNMNAEMRGDMQTRAAYYSTMIDCGAYSVDEVRAWENMGRVDGGDIRRFPLNMIPLDQARSVNEKGGSD